MGNKLNYTRNLRIGLDVGSTTLKCVVLDGTDNIIFKSYERHYSLISQKVSKLFEKLGSELGISENIPVDIAISGSAGMGIAESAKIAFIQEVYATKTAVGRFLPDTDAVIELGGEDAKILFLDRNDVSNQSNSAGGLEVRMNGSCAGGTGAFIDQMATLLNITPSEMNEVAKSHEKIYTIASRCGVFAKSDIQPLINQGAKLEDVSASIFYAVVNQTIAGLAQGRRIKGNVVYLGGPLTFLSELRNSFDDTLKLKGNCPENSLYYVSLGAAFLSDGESLTLGSAKKLIVENGSKVSYASAKPLFKNEKEYDEFRIRHAKANVEFAKAENHSGNAYLGIDAGSTTVKAVLIDENDRILSSVYQPNNGNPVPHVKDFISLIYKNYPDIKIKGTAVTGYGEDIVKNAFRLDYGIVETFAHFTAAKKFMPEVDFIIDIGGQDIKCFKIRNGTIDNIFLNEACSSGCGSFLQTFAGALNYSIEDFAKLGLMAPAPVDLGSRCTVFMNSSVKQAQKDGATLENISAGLSISVVKNALYKVIRAPASNNGASLGNHIVVQGGTFLNDAVLRAFEQEVGHDVVRPAIAGLMGAFGAALYAKSKNPAVSTILSQDELSNFKHDVKAVTCKHCSNNCRLTINTFDGNRKFIGGNRCDRPVTGTSKNDVFNMYEYKLSLLEKYRKDTCAYDALSENNQTTADENANTLQNEKNFRGTIGIPMGLNIYELLPFWHTLLTKLGFRVIVSPQSNRKLYLKGQQTIPSDTVCFPAKLLHGHVDALISAKPDAIFYPCLTYNIDEKLGDNHYNCPVVAYYPEVISANVPELKDVPFIKDYLGIHRPKDFVVKFHGVINRYFDDISLSEVKNAVSAAYDEYKSYLANIRQKGKEELKKAVDENRQVIILAGRPYHIDPEINHGIDRLITSFGAVVLSEDSVSDMVQKFPTKVLNQWTYHSRVYAAAKFIANMDNVNLVQLVSFGCGVDAITTDEVREILESEGKIYTQVKIDEITNLGAVKIRLRSLFATVGQKK